MKKVIKGKRYDTNSAEFLGNYSHGFSGDLEYVSEDLYRKRTGEFFLYGCGGAMSRYAQDNGNGEISSGEEIKPLTYTQAQDWAERNLSGKDYEKIFGTVDEDDERVQKMFSLSKDTVERLKRIAARKNVSLSDAVSDLILAEDMRER